MRPLSLSLRLFWSVLVVMVFTLGVVGMLGLRSANHNISEEYDAQLITSCNVLWGLMHEDVNLGDSFEVGAVAETPMIKKIHRDALREYSKWRAFRIWKGGEVVINSDNSEDMPAQPADQGFSDLRINDDTWRVFALHIPKEDIVVESFENLRNRELLQRDILVGVAAPMVVILPLLALLISLCIRWGLVRLRRLTARLEARSPADLSRLHDDDLPKELVPLAHAVNTLLSKLESALTHEREFIDHAAHELRTPLSALKLQAQLIAKTIIDPVQQTAVNDLLRGVERTVKLVDQLLLLSRIAHQDIVLDAVNLHELAKESIGLHAIRAVDKDITLALEGDDTITVMAQSELLRILIGTLLDNAIKYTPSGGEVVIAVENLPLAVALHVTDSGIGIAEKERPHVFNRFYRASDVKQPGSGLGLAIAKQIANLFHAVIDFDHAASGQGLRVTVSFPHP